MGTVSLMPADNVQGMRADTLALLKELNAPVYRWPGGNFVSGYKWTRRHRRARPPAAAEEPGLERASSTTISAWTSSSFSAALLGTEPYIAVNSGLGDVKAAAEEVQYANGAADTPRGQLRAKTAMPQPYGVKWWSIGNEMYGGWQLGHMPLEQYVEKHNQFAEAMRKIDPSVKLIAVGYVGQVERGDAAAIVPARWT